MATSKLATFLKKSRENSGLSQNKVGDLLGYSTAQFISNWERGISHPPVDSLKKIAHLYGISDKDLFEAVQEAAIEEVKENLKRKFAKSAKNIKGLKA